MRAGPLIIALFAAAGLFLAYQLAGTLLLVFAGILLAVVLDVATLGLGRVLPVSRLARLSIVTTVACLLLAAGIVWGGMRLLTEAKNLVDIASQQASMIGERLESLGILIPKKDAGDASSPLQNFLPDPEQLFGHAQSTFTAATGIVMNTVIILFLAIFFAANPAGYRDGFLKLLPVKNRPRVGQVLEETGHTLRWWRCPSD